MIENLPGTVAVITVQCASHFGALRTVAKR